MQVKDQDKQKHCTCLHMKCRKIERVDVVRFGQGMCVERR